MTPDLSNHQLDVPALGALSERIGDHILVTHSAGGFSGWMSAMQNSEVKGVASYEPGGSCFLKTNVPERIDGLTGGVAGILFRWSNSKDSRKFRLFFISEIHSRNTLQESR